MLHFIIHSDQKRSMLPQRVSGSVPVMRNKHPLMALLTLLIIHTGLWQPGIGQNPESRHQNTMPHQLHSGFMHAGAPQHAFLNAHNYTEAFFESRATTTMDEMEDDTLYVNEFILTRDVVEREPVDRVESYSMSDARAWCFVRIYNSEKMQDVFFKWYYEGELYFEMNSKIGVSRNWRTYSSVGLQPGEWQVTLENRQGQILEELQFRVNE